MIVTLFWSPNVDTRTRGYPNSIVRVPLSGHVAIHPRPGEPIRHNKRGELLPNLWDADVRQHGVPLHHPDEAALPVVAAVRLPHHVWLRRLLRLRRNPFLEQPGGARWRDCTASDSSISMLHVAQDQEAKGVKPILAFELGAWCPWNGS